MSLKTVSVAPGGGGGSGTVTSVAVSGGTTGLTTSGGPVTTSGTITLAGTLAVANGGTGTTTPALVAGTNVTVSGTWPNQTINASGGGGGSGTVTSVAQTFTGGLISVSGSPVTTFGTLALTVAGTSGGIPYFSSSSAWASSAALTQYGVVYGGGAGVSPGVTAAGTAGYSLIANSAAAPTFQQVSLTVGVTGTLPVANGGTGVTASTGANSVVLRDANSNVTANYLYTGYSNTAAAGTTTTLTASSIFNYNITGSGGQTFKLPDATTLSVGAVYTFNNNQTSGTIVVQNNSTTTVATIQSGGFLCLTLLTNSVAAGTWDTHYQAPSNVSWSTNTLDYAGSITSATWNGVAVAANRGGTGVANNAASTLTITGAFGTTFTVTGTTSVTLPTSGTLATTANINTALPSATSSQIYVGTGTAGTAAAASTLPTAAVPAFTGDVTNTAGSLATTVSKIGGNAISLAGALTHAGAFATTITATGTTSVTLPTSGTLAVYPGSGIANSTGSAWGTSYTTTGSGTVVALATSPSFTTPVLGTPTSGNLSNCTADGTSSVGFLNIPQNSQSAAYTLVLADAGKHIFHPSTDANARTYTIPANSSVAYAIGTAITFINMTSQVVTIAITTDTMYLSSAGTTGSRSLAQYGSATAIKMTTTTWLISGSGLT